MNKTRCDLMSETSYIPYFSTKELLDCLPYGSTLSCGIKLLKETGCRISELDRMNPNFIDEDNNIIYWYPGKNQEGKARKEYLRPGLLEELKFNWRHNKRKHDNILPCNHVTFCRYFNYERAKLPVGWREKTQKFSQGGFDSCYVYQLKGFRKVFCTAHFYYFYDKFKDSDIAALMVQKKMRHSHKEITKTYYVQISDEIRKDIKLYIDELNFDYDRPNIQRKMLDFI